MYVIKTVHSQSFDTCPTKWKVPWHIVTQCDHRNLRSRTSMLAHGLANIFWKEHLVKNWLISTLDKVIYFKGTIFQWSTKPLFTSQNRVEISWNKILPFFNNASSSLAPKCDAVSRRKRDTHLHITGAGIGSKIGREALRKNKMMVYDRIVKQRLT
jgi:hypothetical protein